MVRSALAIFAHPDDIEFAAAGTLLLLKDAGYAIHCFVVSSGDLGSTSMGREETIAVRETEARAAVEVLGAEYYPSVAHDLQIVYEVPILRKVAAVVRKVRPDIVLTHSPQDYMEDHMITSRLATTATFSRGMPNFETDPPFPPLKGEVALYHALPHGLRDPLGALVRPSFIVDVGNQMPLKRKALAKHRSQKEWLDASQGMDSYLDSMESLCHETAQRFDVNGDIAFAEGWRQHYHLGFSAGPFTPLQDALRDRILRL